MRIQRQLTRAAKILKKIKLSRILRALLSRYTPVKNRYCVCCQKSLSFFLPYRAGEVSRAPLARAIEMVGSDVENFECPWCGCSDRERHLLLYAEARGLLENLSGGVVIHFAPEKNLSRILQSVNPSSYVACDLHPIHKNVKKIDITSMPFTSASADLIVANHILEHVDDDKAAVAEICRVLKPGGYAILQTPYSPVLHQTWSDPGISTEEMRFHAHGQEDHVRTFGADIFARFTSSGLQSRVALHDQLLPNCDTKRLGINAREPFFLYQRPGL